jgi:hypothetical protein
MAEPKKTNALQKPLKPSAELAAVVGAGTITRGEVVSKIWDYIKKNQLQDPANKREINADDKLQKVFDGKPRVNMFEMNKYLSKHLSCRACARRPAVKRWAASALEPLLPGGLGAQGLDARLTLWP